MLGKEFLDRKNDCRFIYLVEDFSYYEFLQDCTQARLLFKKDGSYYFGNNRISSQDAILYLISIDHAISGYKSLRSQNPSISLKSAENVWNSNPFLIYCDLLPLDMIEDILNSGISEYALSDLSDIDNHDCIYELIEGIF